MNGRAIWRHRFGDTVVELLGVVAVHAAVFAVVTNITRLPDLLPGALFLVPLEELYAAGDAGIAERTALLERLRHEPRDG